MAEQEKQIVEIPRNLVCADQEAGQDVVGLKIPRKRILATFNVTVVVEKLPRRRPHVTFERDIE